jgi:Double zinc ribbon
MFLQLCPVCEHRNPRGSRFCNECGSPLQLRFCPACHAAEDVMSLACRACGEKLPLVALTDAAVEPPDLPVNTASIFRDDVPRPTLSEHLDDVVAVTVHGGAAPAPALEEAGAATILASAAPESVAPAAPAATPASAPLTEDEVSGSPAKTTPNKLTLIERLNQAQAGIEFRSVDIAPPEAPALDTTIESKAPTAAPESEIQIRVEADTLDDASVAPLTYARADEIAIPEPVPIEKIASPQIDEIASQLREGAWPSAMSSDSESTPVFAPALIRDWQRRKRRLSMHRVVLAIAGIGAVAAVAYSVRLGPGTGAADPPPATALPVVHPIGVPMRAVEALPKAGVAAAVPGESAARSLEPAATPPAPVAERASDKPPEKAREKPPDQVAAGAPAQSEPPVAAKPAPARRAAPAVAPETVGTSAARARRAPIETPRPCTPAIAALGLCTTEATSQ